MAEALARTLADYISRRSGATDVSIGEFRRLSGGAIQDNFALTVTLTGGSHEGEQALVVRQDAPSGVDESLTRPQEFRILQAAWEAGVNAPEPLWLCEDTNVTGRLFYVMRRATGSASPQALVRAARENPAQGAALAQQIGREMARLHGVRPPHDNLGFLPTPPADPAQARIDTYRSYLDAITEPHPVLEWALNWLEDHKPAPAAPVLCHCDFRTGNYMAEEGRLTAVLDWEFAAWSDPMEDLGWLCCRSWRFGAFHQEAGGIGQKSDLFQGYETITGELVDADRVTYWEIMALVRWAAIALQQAQRHLSDEEPSLELALTGRMVPEMEYDLLQQIHQLDSSKGH